MVRNTSLEAYAYLKNSGKLSKRRWEVYDVLFKEGPLTSNEVFRHTDLHGLYGYRHNANARMTELRDMGLAAEVGIKECDVTGRNVILWDVTDRMIPLKIKKRMTKNILEQQLTIAIKTLEKYANRTPLIPTKASMALDEINELRETIESINTNAKEAFFNEPVQKTKSI